MMESQKAEEMMDQISQAYGDKEIQELPEVQKFLLENAQLLEKTEA